MQYAKVITVSGPSEGWCIPAPSSHVRAQRPDLGLFQGRLRSEEVVDPEVRNRCDTLCRALGKHYT